MSSFNQQFNVDSFCDADDLMSWLLLHPEMVEFGDDSYFQNHQNQTDEQNASLKMDQNLTPPVAMPYAQSNLMPPAHPDSNFYGGSSIVQPHEMMQHQVVQQPIQQSMRQSMQQPMQQSMPQPMQPHLAQPFHPNGMYFDGMNPMTAMNMQQSGNVVGSMGANYHPILTSDNLQTNRYAMSVKREFGGIDASAAGPSGKAAKVKAGQSASTTNSNDTGSVSKQRTGKHTAASTVLKKKPRESVEDIEARVNQLKSENTDLQAHLMNVMQRTTEVQKQRSEMEQRMIANMSALNAQSGTTKSGEVSSKMLSELSEIVKKYTDIYADYGKCRQREVRLTTSTSSLRQWV